MTSRSFQAGDHHDPVGSLLPVGRFSANCPPRAKLKPSRLNTTNRSSVVLHCFSLYGSPHQDAPGFTASGARGPERAALRVWSKAELLWNDKTSLPFTVDEPDLSMCCQVRSQAPMPRRVLHPNDD